MNTFTKACVIAVSIAGIATQTLAAEDHSSLHKKNNEAIGFGSGLVTGAAVGGPIGAVLGAVFGSLVADQHNNKQEIASLHTVNKQQKLVMANLSSEAGMLKQSLFDKEKAEALELRQVSAQMQVLESPFTNGNDISMQLQFATGSNEVADSYKPQLTGIAHLTQVLPQLQVSVSGYADHRGDDKTNQALSEQRAQSVKTLLTQLGVNNNRILVNAFGEKSASQTDENLFFDRKVTIRLAYPGQQLVKQ